jgi:hypothetical protein
MPIYGKKLRSLYIRSHENGIVKFARTINPDIRLASAISELSNHQKYLKLIVVKGIKVDWTLAKIEKCLLDWLVNFRIGNGGTKFFRSEIVNHIRSGMEYVKTYGVIRDYIICDNPTEDETMALYDNPEYYYDDINDEPSYDPVEMESSYEEPLSYSEMESSYDKSMSYSEM